HVGRAVQHPGADGAGGDQIVTDGIANRRGPEPLRRIAERHQPSGHLAPNGNAIEDVRYPADASIGKVDLDHRLSTAVDADRGADDARNPHERRSVPLLGGESNVEALSAGYAR